MPLIPILAVLACLFLMLNLSLETWLRLFGWRALGVVIYLLYGYRKSRAAHENSRA